MQLRSEANSESSMTVSMGAGKNVIYYACMRHTSLVSCFTSHAVRSWLSIPPRVDSKVSGRSLLLLGLAVLRNGSQLVGTCSRETCLRARMVLSRAGVVWKMDVEMDREA